MKFENRNSTKFCRGILKSEINNKESNRIRFAYVTKKLDEFQRIWRGRCARGSNFVQLECRDGCYVNRNVKIVDNAASNSVVTRKGKKFSLGRDDKPYRTALITVHPLFPPFQRSYLGDKNYNAN